MNIDYREISQKVTSLFSEEFREYQADGVPDISDRRITHGATGINGEFTYLYIDMRNSSKLTDNHRRQTVAKIYKAFHLCMVQIIRAHQGQVRSFDGDRVMGVFYGQGKIDNAVEAAYAMIGCVEHILIPRMRNKYQTQLFDVGIGISTSQTLVIKAGMPYEETSRDLVSIGTAANYAAKLSDKAKVPNRIHICSDTFQNLGEHLKSHSSMVLEFLPIVTNHWSSTSPLNVLFGESMAYSTPWYRQPFTGEFLKAEEPEEE